MKSPDQPRLTFSQGRILLSCMVSTHTYSHSATTKDSLSGHDSNFSTCVSDSGLDAHSLKSSSVAGPSSVFRPIASSSSEDEQVGVKRRLWSKFLSDDEDASPLPSSESPLRK